MKAIVNTSPGILEYLDQPLPWPGAGDVRIRTAACGICATDLEMIDGWQRTGFPSIPGHEWSGVVEACGEGVDDACLGQPCVAENVLSGGGEVGFEHPGGYGQYLVTSARNLHLLPASFSLTSAVLIEPLAVCMRGLRRLRIEDRSSTLIIGDGPIGLLTLMLLKRAGVEHVVMTGGRSGRLKLAEDLGADSVLAYQVYGDGLAQELLEIAPGGFANVIEATGSEIGARTALDAAAKYGHVLILGDYRAAQAGFRWNQVLHCELEIIGSNASAGGWSEAVAAALGDELPLHRLISAVYPATDFQRAFSIVRGQGEAVVKIILDWG